MSSLLSHFPSLKLRSRDTKLRSGKRLRFASGCMGWGTDSSGNKKQAVRDEEFGDDGSIVEVRIKGLATGFASTPKGGLNLLDMPEELLDGLLVDALDTCDLLRLAQTCKKFRDIAHDDSRWRAFFEAKWGTPNSLRERAAEIAGSWKVFYGTKKTLDSLVDPWCKPTAFEISASVENIALGGLGLTKASACTPSNAQEQEPERSVVFLVDGSGSVTEAPVHCTDDFCNMTGFMSHAWHAIHPLCASAKVGIVQFSNDVRVEVTPAAMTPNDLDGHVAKMTRMNGGTNISAAIKKAGQLLGGTKGPGGHSSIVLLTDGRVDGYQASEAVEMAARLMDEVPGNVSFYAFGVGRGVDKVELLRIVGAGGPPADESRYLGLCTYEDGPW